MDGLETAEASHTKELRELYRSGFNKGMAESGKSGRALGQLEYALEKE